MMKDSLLICSNSVIDNDFDEIKEALISPLFFEHSFIKLSKILITKKYSSFFN